MIMILMQPKVKKDLSIYLANWIILETLGCGSLLDLVPFEPDYCNNKGEGCFDRTGDYGEEMIACCCKGDM